MIGVYLCEVKAIQPFIFESGKLKEIIGASERIASLMDPHEGRESLLDAVLAVTDAGHVRFLRRAGGALVAASEDLPGLKRFTELWSLALRMALPGMEIVQGHAEAETVTGAWDAARRQIQHARAAPVLDLPARAPVMARYPRTGRPARFRIRVPGDAGTSFVQVDALTRIKRGHVDAGALAHRFLDSADAGFTFPDTLDADPASDERAFPFIGSRHLVGIVHADGTGLGQLLLQFGRSLRGQSLDRHVRAYAAVSDVVSEASLRAARSASKVLVAEARSRGGQVLAARPVISGGDDFSAIVRADLAVAYTRAWVEAFEAASGELLAIAHQDGCIGLELPARLTSCASIVFVQRTQPFAAAHALAESQVKSLKRHLDTLGLSGKTSALAFCRDHAGGETAIEDFDARLQHGAAAGFLPWLPAYRVSGETHDQLAELDALLAIHGRRDLPLARLRELRGLLSTQPEQAQVRYARLAEHALKSGSADPARYFDGLSHGTEKHPGLPFFRRFSATEPFRAPLIDLQTLAAITDQEAT